MFILFSISFFLSFFGFETCAEHAPLLFIYFCVPDSIPLLDIGCFLFSRLSYGCVRGYI